MEKKNKNQSISIIESSINKWFDAETERLVSRGEDINNIFIVADPYYIKGTIICDTYTMKFNRNEEVIDLIVNGEKDSRIWDNVIHCVLAQFASCFGDPKNFLYRVSSNTSEEKKFYGCATIVDVDVMLPINRFTAIEDWKAKNFDELIG